MKIPITKADLHVHSKHSVRPSQWILQKIGCPESFTEPLQIYKLARSRGMSLVTITDHNTISGSYEIADLPGTFLSEEITTYFPEDGCKIHVLAYDITEAQHGDIQKARENIFDLVEYLQTSSIYHAVAHPIFSVNDKLTLAHVEKLILLFKTWELNGARDPRQNEVIKAIFERMKPADVELLANRHNIEPKFPEPWRKHYQGGSDDHSAIYVAATYTQIEGTASVPAFLSALRSGEGEVVSRHSSPETLAHTLYAIAYQFYKNKLGFERYVNKDILFKFLDQALEGNSDESLGLFSRIRSIWSGRRLNGEAKASFSFQELIRFEAEKLIRSEPELMRIVDGEGDALEDVENRWFGFVDRVSSKVVNHFANHIFDHLSGANVFSLFHSVGSAGGLYSLLAPYFVAYSIFSREVQLSEKVLHAFTGEDRDAAPAEHVKVAHFTDTLFEVNGVAATLLQHARIATSTNKDLTIITCETGDGGDPPAGVRVFKPAGVYELPEYPEQKLFYPPFLEMLRYVYSGGFSHIHSATPGPIGLAALAIARILNLSIYGTYHTALPQYAQYLTNDGAVEELVWRYTLWYYDQMEIVYVPSESTARELIGRGIAKEKVRLFARGIDSERFHPSKRNGSLKEHYGIDSGLKMLYVGRVSREKNLEVLEKAYKSLLASTDQEVRLVIVGDGPYLDQMRENLAGTPCLFTGYLQGEDLASIYASCDLFVFPSTTDTFGNVVLEAQASGLPVIVTDMGGPQENVIPGKTGLVVKGNDEKSLLRAMRTLVRDRTRIERMGKEARKYVEERTFEAAFEESWQIYQNHSAGEGDGRERKASA